MNNIKNIFTNNNNKNLNLKKYVNNLINEWNNKYSKEKICNETVLQFYNENLKKI